MKDHLGMDIFIQKTAKKFYPNLFMTIEDIRLENGDWIRIGDLTFYRPDIRSVFVSEPEKAVVEVVPFALYSIIILLAIYFGVTTGGWLTVVIITVISLLVAKYGYQTFKGLLGDPKDIVLELEKEGAVTVAKGVAAINAELIKIMIEMFLQRPRPDVETSDSQLSQP